MKILKTILRHNIVKICLLLFLIIYLIAFNVFIKNSVYTNGVIQKEFKVLKITKDDLKYSFILKNEKKIIATYYYEDNLDISLGDTIFINGEIEDINNNTIEGNFNYKNYLKTKKIYKKLLINDIKVVKKNNSLLYKIKNNFHKRCTNKYVKLYILLDSSDVDMQLFNDLSITYLFTLTGFHIAILIKILKKIKINNIIIFLLLLFYFFLTDSFTIYRILIFFILKIFKLKRKEEIFYSFLIILFINPYMIYSSALWYSYSALIGLYFTRYKSHKKRILNIFIKSFYISLFTLPVSINLYFNVNILSFIYSGIMIPINIIIIYPVSIISFIIPKLSFVLDYVMNINNIIISKISILSINVIFSKMDIGLIIIYYFLLIMFVYYNYKKVFLIIIVILLINNFKVYFDNTFYITYFDVSQSDAELLRYKNNTILIDTSLGSSNKIISYLNSKGLDEILVLVLSHGDADHMGDAIDLINNIKIKNVIFNCGEYNDLEKKLINVLEKKNINYYSCTKDLNIDKYKLQFLNTGVYDNENDNSSVIYLNYNNYKFLFMGDAGVEREKDILDKYNLKDIDFLKVGHHGSNTSSSEVFINSINPKYSLISVGKNNRYGHPKESVLNILNNSKIYRTDLDGSIEIKLNKSGYKIKTCPP